MTRHSGRIHMETIRRIKSRYSMESRGMRTVTDVSIGNQRARRPFMLSRRVNIHPGVFFIGRSRKVSIRLFVTCALLTGCSEDGDEVLRLRSPDGQFDGVVVEKGGGATTSFQYVVCVVPVSQKCDFNSATATLYDAARNSKAYGVNLRWAGSSQLAVEYTTAAREELIQPPAYGGRKVHVVLKSGVVDTTAAPGAMARKGKH